MWQLLLISVIALLSIVFWIAGLVVSRRGKSYGKFWPLNLIGAFVWGDALVFGPFWILAAILCIALQNWWLFELIFLCFWLIRSLGETIYWFLQQFSNVVREKPEKVFFYPLVKNNSVWFLMQIWWQCISITALVLLILLLR